MSSANPHPWIGRCLGDNLRYRLDRRLGGGGMGDVFLATDTKIGQQVALKLLKDTLVESTEMRERFDREIKISASLPSDHIVRVSDSGVTPEGYPFYVMEYLQGQSLGDLLRRESRISLDRTAKIMSQICNGLSAAHQKSVVHRDLKPDNIFLLSTDLGDWVKIVDFGIAKIRTEHSEQLTLTRAFLGTLRYSSPEQMMGDPKLDGRADIYSLGVMMYEMLSGADPFGFSLETNRVSEAAWIGAHTHEPPKSLRAQSGCEHLPPELDELVCKCLAKKPWQRFDSVAELDTALKSIVNSSSNRTTVQPRPEPAGDDLDPTIKHVRLPLPPDPDPAPIINPIGGQGGTTVQPHPDPDPTLINPIGGHIGTTVQPRPDPIPDPIVNQGGGHIGTTVQPRPDPIPDPIVNQGGGHIGTTVQPRPDPIPDPIVNQGGGHIGTTVQPRPDPIPDPIVNQGGGHIGTTVQPRPDPDPTPIEPPEKSINLGIQLGAVAIFGLLAGGIYTYFQSHTNPVTEISSLKQQLKYPECIASAEQITANNSNFDRAQKLLNECRLSYAIDLKAKDRLVEAIDMVKKIPSSSHVYSEAQQRLKEWTVF